MISIALISIMLLIVGCSNNTNSSTVTKESSATKWYQDLSAQEFKSVIEDPEVFVLDVHTPEQPHIKGTDAVIPFDKLEVNLAKLPKDKNTKIALYCRSGSMSKEASEELITLGYTNINNLEGGANAWKNEGFPVEELVK